VKNAPQVKPGALAVGDGKESRAIGINGPSLSLRGDKWSEFEVDAAVTSFFQYQLTQEKLRQDSLLTQKKIEAATVALVVGAVVGLLAFGMTLVSNQNKPSQYNHGSISALHKAV
jgi:hypothetical protein